MAQETLVDMRSIDKHFGGLHAVQNVSIDLMAGEVHGLLGHNGAGKSTLIKILSGALTPDAGEIRIRGRRVELRTPRDAKRLGIETIHQSLALAENLPAPANVFLGRELTHWFGALDETAMEYATRNVMKRINPAFDTMSEPVVSLSGGQRQTVAIARALQFDTRVLIMDEPTAALGPSESQMVAELVNNLKREGIGIFMISHDLHDILGLADRVSVMKGGRLVGTHQANELTHEEVLQMIIMGTPPTPTSDGHITETG